MDVGIHPSAMRSMFEGVNIEKLPLNTQCTFCVMALDPQLATKMCKECRRPICDDCSKSHSMDRRYKNHHFQLATASGLYSLSCKKHVGEDIKYFCTACNKAICTECKDSAGHAQHISKSLDEGLSLVRKDLTEKRLAMHGLLDRTNKIMKNTSDLEKVVQQDFEKVIAEVENRAIKMIDQVTDWQREMMDTLMDNKNSETKIWNQRVEELHTMAAKINSVASQLEGMITDSDDINFIEQTKGLSEMLSNQEYLDEEILEPLEKPSVAIDTPKSGNGTLPGQKLRVKADSIKGMLGEVKVITYNQKYVNVSAFLPPSPDLPPRVDAQPSYAAPKKPQQPPRPPRTADKPPKIAVKPRGNPAPEVGARSTTSPVHNTAGMTPKSPATPLSPVPSPRRVNSVEKWELPNDMDRKLLWSAHMGSNPGEVYFPVSMDFTSDGLTVVSEAGSMRVQCFDRKGNSVWTYGDTRRKIHPRGLAVSPEDVIYVSDTYTKTIFMLDMNGKCLGKWGNFDLDYPKDVTFNETTGNVIVADKGTGNIIISASNGRQIKVFGSKGSQHDQFKEPNYVTTDSRGRILVSDIGNMEIKIFNNFGIFQKKFTPTVNGRRQSFHGITMDESDNILVAMHDIHQIAKFSPDGEFIEMVLGKPEIWRPAIVKFKTERLGIAETQSEEKHSTVKVFRL